MSDLERVEAKLADLMAKQDRAAERREIKERRIDAERRREDEQRAGSLDFDEQKDARTRRAEANGPWRSS